MHNISKKKVVFKLVIQATSICQSTLLFRRRKAHSYAKKQDVPLLTCRIVLYRSKMSTPNLRQNQEWSADRLRTYRLSQVTRSQILMWEKYSNRQRSIKGWKTSKFSGTLVSSHQCALWSQLSYQVLVNRKIPDFLKTSNQLQIGLWKEILIQLRVSRLKLW